MNISSCSKLNLKLNRGQTNAMKTGGLSNSVNDNIPNGQKAPTGKYANPSYRNGDSLFRPDSYKVCEKWQVSVMVGERGGEGESGGWDREDGVSLRLGVSFVARRLANGKKVLGKSIEVLNIKTLFHFYTLTRSFFSFLLCCNQRYSLVLITMTVRTYVPPTH